MSRSADSQELSASLASLKGLPFVLSDYVKDTWEHRLFLPLMAFLDRPGKQLRAKLVRAGYRSTGGDPATFAQIGILERVVEAIHAGSLIVDDIQDNSDIRRGEPCFHKLHGSSQAINAGNWLYFWAVREIENLQMSHGPILEKLILDALFEGHMGQALDLSLQIDQVPQAEIAATCTAAIHLKTGCLTALALTLGAAAGGAETSAIKALKRLGYGYGSLLQSYDDLKNLRISPELDPKFAEDLKHRRPSFVWSFASEKMQPAEYQEFLAAVRELPKYQRLAQILRESAFFPKAESELNRQRQLFVDSVGAPAGLNAVALRAEIFELTQHLVDHYGKT